jgi:hypothetical protein
VTPSNDETGCAAMGLDCQPEAQQEMPYFVGVKVIQAVPMSLRDFNQRKGRESNQENAPGYLVRYPDGYESWSPARAFEDAYFEMCSKDVAEHMALEVKAILETELPGQVAHNPN